VPTTSPGSPGSSGASQARKLGLKPGLRTATDAAPDGWALDGPPAGLLPPDPDGAADVIIAFFRAADEIAGRLPPLAGRVFPAGAVWALWPRRAAGHVSDITDNVVRSCALDLGLVDVKVAAVDGDWSGLRLVWRTTNRLSMTMRLIHDQEAEVRRLAELRGRNSRRHVGSAGPRFVVATRGLRSERPTTRRRLA
jgi:hypothetical protein